MINFNFSNFISPFTWRYGSDAMRNIFSEENKYKIWRKIWVVLAQGQYEAGLISKKELDDLRKNKNNIDIDKILEIEKETKHDVVAAIREYAQKARIGGGKIHLGATSMDIVDNTETIRLKDGLKIVEKRLKELLKEFCLKIEKYADFACMGYTHLQPAEPTTVGYRLAFYAQDLLTDYYYLKFVKENLQAKGFKGAVGTSASYKELLKGKKINASDLDKKVSAALDLKQALITSQTYSRKMDFLVMSLLSSISSSCAKFASDLRILQSPQIGEWGEPFGKNQVGSSAMPFKKNPINCEKICSLARYLLNLPATALENASLSYLERTLDDSANRRLIIPEAFLAIDEIMITAQKIISGLVINEEKITYNLDQFAPFASSELIMIETVKKGANRQEIHELIREISLRAWKKIQNGKKNPLINLIINNRKLNKYISEDRIIKLMKKTNHIGDVYERTILLVNKIKKEL